MQHNLAGHLKKHLLSAGGGVAGYAAAGQLQQVPGRQENTRPTWSTFPNTAGVAPGKKEMKAKQKIFVVSASGGGARTGLFRRVCGTIPVAAGPNPEPACPKRRSGFKPEQPQPARSAGCDGLTP